MLVTTPKLLVNTLTSFNVSTTDLCGLGTGQVAITDEEKFLLEDQEFGPNF